MLSVLASLALLHPHRLWHRALQGPPSSMPAAGLEARSSRKVRRNLAARLRLGIAPEQPPVQNFHLLVRARRSHSAGAVGWEWLAQSPDAEA